MRTNSSVCYLPIALTYLFLVILSMASGCSSPEKSQNILDTSVYTSVFGKNVLVFDNSMDMDHIRETLHALHQQQQYNEFGSERYALLFKPGNYDLDVTVDYYVQALGLGRYPGDVVINGSVQSITTTSGNGVANKVTTMFWRGAENFKVVPKDNKMIYWAVSQAAPYRRMHVAGDINFDKGSWASGGLLANSLVEGRAGLTSGQQWLTRNSKITSWEGGNWNRVFVGVEGAPGDLWPDKPTTVIDKTPVIREKPFLTLTGAGDYAVFVPSLQRETSGPTWINSDEKGELLPITSFYITDPEKDNAASINQALAAGKNMLFTPGIYELDETLAITKPNTIILGLGLPTLIPQNGMVALRTADVPGIIMAGFMVDAGPVLSPTLIQIGSEGSDVSFPDNPISLHDIYCRVGGAVVGKAETALTINSNHVIGDHFWLWRADHGVGTEWMEGQNKHGLVVNGDHVTIYGLFNEHFQSYQTLWRGEYGSTYFYQSEIPYHPPSFEQWNDNGKPGWASYKVEDFVQYHEAYGLGIYSFFSGEPTVSNKVRLENAMEVPDNPGIVITHIATFAGLNGGINHPINGFGPATEIRELKLYTGFKGGR
ncbi:coagulation factor 5/8 type domain-containing protein [Lentiprolixibacter aurantiacus]|uniref:Coagulation factor 5/8 type domain-containing protein n=1 Tax=Lentiprolixibacter aurantiacus TaxID=2993939 RepID=A0AAE3ML62_9FLAO|nr:coagulation factor 5/8 type domain-containing protein [Lentiprolixibacter aurantiacus]MCX2719756.1 coagulation factor 5/8 type domain-containing protein [Lentiprolixibacter aurantiacus]